MAASAPKRVKIEDVGERSWVGLISLIDSRVDADIVDRVYTIMIRKMAGSEGNFAERTSVQSLKVSLHPRAYSDLSFSVNGLQRF